MLAKRVSVYLLASVFSVAIHLPSATAQSAEVNCDKEEARSELRGKCDENVKLNRLDRTITNSTTQGDESNASANSADGADNDSADGDNGHGNDPDHDDPSNPGKGDGNHGTGDNGNGNGRGK